MTDPRGAPRDIEAILLDDDAIIGAMRAAGLHIIEEHRRLGIPLLVWEDGRIRAIPAAELPVAASDTE